MILTGRHKLTGKCLPRRLREEALVLLIGGFIITLSLGFFTVFPPEFVRFADGKVYDVLLQSLPTGRTTDLPVVVGVDDRSLEEYGQWPWPRYRLARLVEKIHALGALCIGLDLMLAEPDRSSISVIRKAMARDLGVVMEGGAPQFEDNDRILAEALSETPVVLGFKFLFDTHSAEPKDEWLHPLRSGANLAWDSGRLNLPVATDVLCNLPSLSRAARISGFVNAKADPDGVLRRVPLVMEYNKRLYPSLALACLIQTHKKAQVAWGSNQDGPFLLWSGRRVPLDRSGSMLVRFRGGRKSFPFVSASDILADRVAPGSLQGKIVFVGSWGSGLGDRHMSPLDRSFPGAEVHANLVDNLLKGDFLYRPAWAPGAELFAVLLTGLSVPLLMVTAGVVSTLVINGLAGAGIWLFFQWLFRAHGLFLSPVMPLALLATSFTVLNLLKYGLEKRKVRLHSQALIQAQDATILSLAALSETRDEDTGGHIHRTQRYVQTLAKRLSNHPEYRYQLDARTIDLLFKSAPLHDIGKVGIPDSILCKPGKLTDTEFELMKRHCAIGGKVLGKTEKILGNTDGRSFLRLAREMAETHHERWDGSGYPGGLKGREIPLWGRLMALADTYDALISRRVYKPAFSHHKAREIILEARGTHFDPDVVDAFLEEEETFRRIASDFADTEK
jgi:CHASE2 domain-containing sensor protein